MNLKFFFFFPILLISLQIVAQKSLLEKQGDQFFFHRNYKSAIRSYLKTKEISINGKRNLALAFKQMGKWREAEEIFSEIVYEKGANTNDFENYVYVLKINGKNKLADQFIQLKGDTLAGLTKKDSIKTQVSTIDSSLNPVFGSQNKELKWFWIKPKVKNLKLNPLTINWQKSPVFFYTEDSLAPFINKEAIKIANEWADIRMSYASELTQFAYDQFNLSAKGVNQLPKLQLFIRKLNDKGRFETEKFKLNSENHSVGHPYLTQDGQTLFFVSDRAGGYGGADIYKIERMKNARWTKAVNLGKQINSPADEIFPFFDEVNQTLYFSSNGRAGAGGFDIFRVLLYKDSLSDVEQLPLPINSRYDDFCFQNIRGGKGSYFSRSTIDIKNPEAYYVELEPKELKSLELIQTILMDSIEEETTPNESKIIVLNQDSLNRLPKVAYAVNNPETKSDQTTEPLEPSFFLCKILDAITGLPLQGIKVVVEDLDHATIQSLVTTDSGVVRMELPRPQDKEKMTLVVSIEGDGHISKKINYVDLVAEGTEYVLIEVLEPSPNEPVWGTDLMKLEEIYNVYFDLAKYELLDSSKVSLMRIVEFMKKYENTRVEIRAHTDCRGTASFNLSLSDIRARVVATFISNFIRKDRIQYKGFEETRLVNSCSCEGQQIVPCLEQEHKKNRRVEIVVIK